MTRLQEAFARLADDLERLQLRWALIGGLAVSARAEPRSTRDVDVVVVVEDDDQAETVTSLLTARGYRIQSVLEHQDVGRMATVRFVARGESPGGVLVDLFFASSGVEGEIVDAAEDLELWPGMTAPVAATGHLLALKVLSSRPRDLEDIRWLLERADAEDLSRAREAFHLMKERGFDRQKDLEALFERAVEESTDRGPFIESERSK